MVAEICREVSQPLVDLGGPLLGGLGETCARAVEAGPGPLQKPRLLARQIERGRLVAELGDAAKQRSVHADRIPVPRLLQRHFGFDLKKLRIGVRAHEVIEHRRDPGEQLARALQRGDGVLEVGSSGLALIASISAVWSAKALSKAGGSARGDLREGRRLERRLPGPAADWLGRRRSVLTLRGLICSDFQVLLYTIGWGFLRP
jgi:hypothetical protein